ncbi:hypothetical protein QQ045_004898 [Rhodiola kirilowii]
MKRRDFEEVYDDLPLFDLQTLPRKARRLDCQFTPRYEEAEVNLGVERRLQVDQSVTICTAVHDDDVPIMDVAPSCNPKEERALALFQPADLLRSPSPSRLEIKVHPDLVDDLRNYRYQITSAYTPEVNDQPPNTTSNLAVIPWVDHPKVHGQPVSTCQPMEADTDSEMMDTDECTMNTSEGLQQQQQQQHQHQHCLLPQASPTNTASPVSWW